MKEIDEKSPYTSRQGLNESKENVAGAIGVILLALIFFGSFIGLLISTDRRYKPYKYNGTSLVMAEYYGQEQYEERMRQDYSGFTSELYVGAPGHSLNIGVYIGDWRILDEEASVDVFEATARYFAREDIQEGISRQIEAAGYYTTVDCGKLYVWVWGRSTNSATSDYCVIRPYLPADDESEMTFDADGLQMWEGWLYEKHTYGLPPQNKRFFAATDQGEVVFYEYEGYVYTNRDEFVAQFKLRLDK